MKKAILSLSTLCIAASLFAAEKEQVSVYVMAPEMAEAAGGLVTPDEKKAHEELIDSTKDIEKRIKKEKTLALVENEESAALTVAVVARTWKGAGTYTVRYEEIGDRVSVREDGQRHLVVAVYKGGELVTVLQNKAGGMFNMYGSTSWGAAAGSIVNQLKDLVKENKKELLKK